MPKIETEEQFLELAEKFKQDRTYALSFIDSLW